MKTILLAGTASAIASTLALGLLAKLEGKGALQPINATSHWLHGEAAARFKDADIAHTGVGLATHQAATFFWAGLFNVWLSARRPQRPMSLFTQALAVSAIAAAVDYGATPKRFTPGWEFVLSKRSMAAAYAAMAFGMAVGGLLAQPPSRLEHASSTA